MYVITTCVSSLLTESRIVSFATGLDHRFYPQWCFRVLHMSSLPKGEFYQTHDPIEETVSACNVSFQNTFSFQVATSMRKLYKLGAHLSRLHTVSTAVREVCFTSS